MSTKNPQRRVVEVWTTISATPLPPGWRNVYRTPDGGTLTHDAPALLVQELREVVTWTVTPHEDRPDEMSSRTTSRQPPYETRVVFADHEGGYLDPVTDVGNYVDTVGPGDPMPNGQEAAA